MVVMVFPVYLVEDDPRLQTLLTEAINTVGDAQVIGVAQTESHAVDWLNCHPQDWKLLVLDLFLTDGTGFGVLHRLKPQNACYRTIVLTNSANLENRNRCLALGALAIYDKTTELHLFLDHCSRYQH